MQTVIDRWHFSGWKHDFLPCFFFVLLLVLYLLPIILLNLILRLFRSSTEMREKAAGKDFICVCRPRHHQGPLFLIVGTKMPPKNQSPEASLTAPRPYLTWQKINQRMLMTILHANWWVGPMCTIFYFHAPIWEFARECGNCSCKAENAGVMPFLELGSCLALSSSECCWIFCDVIYIRILFIKRRSHVWNFGKSCKWFCWLCCWLHVSTAARGVTHWCASLGCLGTVSLKPEVGFL